MPNKNHPIDTHEATRALYLDFEGPGPSKKAKKPLPVLGGVLCEENYLPTALDPRLKDAAIAKGIGYASLDNFLESLLERAGSQHRRIVYWTSHEKQLFEDRGYPPNDIGFDVRIDARESATLKPLFTQFNRDNKERKNPTTSRTRRDELRPKAFGLLTLLAQDRGLPRPHQSGAGKVGHWLKTVVVQAETKPSFADWARSGKTSLTKVIKHNEHDCRATEFLLSYLLKTTPIRENVHR